MPLECLREHWRDLDCGQCGEALQYRGRHIADGDFEIVTRKRPPIRVQLRRTSGWRMPENTVSVARPGRFGNPFTISAAIESEYVTAEHAQAFVVECFRDWMSDGRQGRDWWQGEDSDRRKAAIKEGLPGLRGKNLACWCPLDRPCHADVLLELANREIPA
ncbi:hypothetical protein HY78_08465 [Rhizorhabdus wittichii DC-6]|nr:hypothetical protein HY78_08465 [Rhizorhabdus wittichii DC-6]